MEEILDFLLQIVQTFSVWDQIVLIILGICLLIQLYYYFRFYCGIFRHCRRSRKGKTPYREDQPSVSVIICARDEEANLQEFLPKVLTQDYPDYEVIIVDDRSSDHSEDVLEQYKQQYPHLRTTFIPENAKFIDSKKMAVTLGIKAAQNELLVFTDADCYPTSEHWLGNMVRNFTNNTDFVLGYGGYQRKKGLLNRFICFDTLFIGIQYLSYALAGYSYMGVGRNMAYRKSMYTQSRGFAKHLNLQSGDDDLFVNENSNSHNTRIEIAPGSTTLSVPKDSFELWFLQKERHLSTSPFYRIGSKLLLGFELGSRALFYLFVILGLCTGNAWVAYLTLILFGIRYLVQYIVINLAAKHLQERKFWIGILFFDISLPLLQLYLHIKAHFRPISAYKWK